jgi:uncharacterized protein YqeY
MTLQDKLSADLKQAMRDRDQNRLVALRMLRAAIVNKEVEVGHPLDDAEVMVIAAREARERRESIEAFRAGKREDLVRQEEAQLQILQDYMPQQMSREEVEQAAREAIAETGAAGPGDLGAVMRVLMPRLKGKADGALVNQVVRELLATRS